MLSYKYITYFTLFDQAFTFKLFFNYQKRVPSALGQFDDVEYPAEVIREFRSAGMNISGMPLAEVTHRAIMKDRGKWKDKTNRKSNSTNLVVSLA